VCGGIIFSKTVRFEFYSDAIASVPKLSVDGTVDNAVHFSHWKGNRTPESVKADTSTEIALNLVAAADRDRLTQGIDLITNNHFDTDGVLSVWTVLMGERALSLREKLISAAEAGDFCELSSEAGVRASIVIQGSDSPTDNTGSPLAQQLAGEQVDDDARSFELVLPYVERVLTHTGEYEPLWRGSWERIARALESFAKGTSHVEADEEAMLSIITLAPEVFSTSGFNPERDSAPFTAITQNARGEVFLIATPLKNGWAYRIDYPYYSWAETVVRPRIVRRDLSELMNQLNQLEGDASGKWKVDSSELSSAAKFVDEDGRLGRSRLQPDVVRAEVRGALIESRSAAAR
jgi:hypothetical protein